MIVPPSPTKSTTLQTQDQFRVQHLRQSTGEVQQPRHLRAPSARRLLPERNEGLGFLQTQGPQHRGRSDGDGARAEDEHRDVGTDEQ